MSPAYNERIQGYVSNPRNVGSLDPHSQRVGTGVVGEPQCGDVMKLQIEAEDDGRIVDAKFKTFGCGAAVAATALATEWLKGRSVYEADKLTDRRIAAALSLPRVKIHCSVLAADAVQAAVEDWKAKRRRG